MAKRLHGGVSSHRHGAELVVREFGASIAWDGVRGSDEN